MSFQGSFGNTVFYDTLQLFQCRCFELLRELFSCLKPPNFRIYHFFGILQFKLELIPQ